MTGVMVSGRGRPNFKMAGTLMNKKKFKACAPLGADSFEIKMKKANGKLAGVLMNKFKALNV